MGESSSSVSNADGHDCERDLNDRKSDCSLKFSSATFILIKFPNIAIDPWVAISAHLFAILVKFLFQKKQGCVNIEKLRSITHWEKLIFAPIS